MESFYESCISILCEFHSVYSVVLVGMLILQVVFLACLGWKCTAVISEVAPPELFPGDYNKHEPPWKKGKPAHVYIQLDVLDIDKIDEGDLDFHILCYLDEFWNDTRLNLSMFTKSDSGSSTFPTYLVKDIWVPDLIMDNTKSGMVFQLSLPNTLITVQEDGSLMKTTRYYLVVSCTMNFVFYPMDTQYCFIKFSSMANPEFKVVLHWVDELTEPMPGIEIMNDIKPLKYFLKEPRTFKSIDSVGASVLYANFTFERRLSSTVFNVYIPSTLIILLSWISFWIDIEAVPARVTLGVTSLLTLATQMVQAKSKLPTISYMTAVDVWVFFCLLMVFSSLLEFAICYHRYTLIKESFTDLCQSANAKRVSDLRILQTRIRDRFKEVDERWKASTPDEEDQYSKKLDMWLDKLCRKLFPFLFGVFCASYWSFYLTMRE